MSDDEAVRIVANRLDGLATGAPLHGATLQEELASCADALRNAVKQRRRYDPEHVRDAVRAFRALRWPAKLVVTGALPSTPPVPTAEAALWLESWRMSSGTEQANILRAIAYDVQEAVNALAVSRAATDVDTARGATP